MIHAHRSVRTRLAPALATLAALSALAALPAAAAAQGVVSAATAPFSNFESGAVRPLLLSSGGRRLYALNTADGRLEIYSTGVTTTGVTTTGVTTGGVTTGGATAGRVPQLAPLGEVFTGLEPVAMAEHPDHHDILFVANLLSDSVSVVDLAQLAVVATIPVGDEPQDVIVSGGQLYVATARSAAAPDFTQPGEFVENAVVVAQAEPPYAIVKRIAVPGHKPRALAEAGGRVYVVPQNSGNHTTALSFSEAKSLGLEQTDLDAFDQPFALNPALALPQLLTGAFKNGPFNTFGWAIPVTGRIVFDSEFPGLTPQLADADIIDVEGAALPAPPPSTTGVGTTLLALARNPVTGDLWVANTQARNRTRFEPVLSGQAFENRVTIAAPGGAVKQVIQLAPPTTASEHAQPVALAFYDGGGAGPFGYVACLGDASITVLDASSGAVVQEFTAGELPEGLAVDQARGLLYVFSRGDKTVRAYDILNGHAPIGRTRPLGYDPEPQGVAAGRTHLYDARAATGAGTGNFSCASCHVFGHMDQLGWDLGNPQGGLGYFAPDIMKGTLGFANQQVALKTSLMTHPMKGPMTTQSLRGLSDAESAPLHWRGDRRFFQNFRGAFVGLLGGSGISSAAMQDYAAFVRSLTYPPNPYEPKDRVYTGDAAVGRDLFGMNPQVPGKEYNAAIPGTVLCISCHTGDFSGKTGFTGSQATVNFDGEDQLFNAGQLRGIYEKEFAALTGFGTLHDGSIPGIQAFLDFVPATGVQAFPLFTPTDRAQTAAFVRAFDTGLSPLVGTQFSASEGNTSGLYDWLDLAEIQSVAPESNVDLIGKTLWQRPGKAPLHVGLRYAFDSGSQSLLYQLDTGLPGAGTWVSRGFLVSAIAAGRMSATFTCVPPGLGARLGIDRDEDGLLDNQELAFGTDPARADTDGDGYTDLAELQAGTAPAVPDAFVPDATAPAVTQAEPRDVFADTATLHVVLDEPAAARVELGLSAGAYDLLAFEDDALRSAHDVTLDDLPAATTLFFRVTARDRNGNAGTDEGSFKTTAALYRVADIQLAAAGAPGPLTLTATVLVHDGNGAPVDNVPVRGLWAGDIGMADFFPLQRTDASGTATFTVGPYTPAAPTTVTFSPAYLGTTVNADPFFIGLGGSAPKFLYDPSGNAVNFASVSVP